MSESHLGADGFVDLENARAVESHHRQFVFQCHLLFQDSLDFGILCRTLCGLREEFHRPLESNPAFGNRLPQCGRTVDHDGVPFRLADQPQHFGVAGLAEDDDLSACRLHPFVGIPDLPLEAKYHWAGAVYYFKSLIFSQHIGFRRFSVRSEHHARTLWKTVQILLAYGPETLVFQS